MPFLLRRPILHSVAQFTWHIVFRALWCHATSAQRKAATPHLELILQSIPGWLLQAASPFWVSKDNLGAELSLPPVVKRLWGWLGPNSVLPLPVPPRVLSCSLCLTIPRSPRHTEFCAPWGLLICVPWYLTSTSHYSCPGYCSGYH